MGVYAISTVSGRDRLVLELLGVKSSVISRSGKAVTEGAIRVENDLPACLKAMPGRMDWRAIPEARDCPWLIRSTSGTTGTPKVFVTTHGEGTMRRLRYFDATGAGRPGGSFLSFTPLRFAASRQRVFYTLSAGGRAFLPEEGMSIPDLVALAGRFRISDLYIVPMHLEILCKSATGGSGLLFPFVRQIETTSSRVSAELFQRVVNSLSPNFAVVYSMSETGHLTSTWRSRYPESELASVGSPVADVEIRLFPLQVPAGHFSGAGEIGIRFRSRPLRIDYLTGDGTFCRTTDDEGWFRTGDVGYLSPQGNLVFLGRRDDMMIFNGINIYPGEIEEVLLAHPDIRQAAAFPVRSRVNQEIPCAAVVVNGAGGSGGDLTVYCRQQLGARAPRVILVLPDLPKDPRGKILRRELQKLAIAKINAAPRGTHRNAG